MNTLQIVYKILHALEYGDETEYAGQRIGPEKLNVPEDKWIDAIRTLSEDGLITGANIYTDILGNPCVNIKNVKITLKGAEYLQENSVMRKFAKVATDIVVKHIK